MTLISKYANAIHAFLSKIAEDDKEQKFKIFIRAGFQIDVYVFVRDCQQFTDVEQKFDDFCKETDDFANLTPVKNNHSYRIFFNVLPISELDDPFYSNIVDCPNCIDYGPRYRFDSFLGQNKSSLIDKKKYPPIITFYSYKGGMGRTTTMISYALHLAKMSRTIAVIDCDLEAPGYLNFFDLSEHEELKENKKNGLVEFLCDSQFAGKEIDINNYIINVGARNPNIKQHPELLNIWLIPAGNLNEGTDDEIFSQNRQVYLEGLAKINLGNTQSVVNGFNLLFDKLKDLNVDAILIDSRTGFNDIFGTTALYLSSCVIGFFGLSRQTDPGFMNLLYRHGSDNNIFKLILAYSILPKDKNDIPPRMQSFINRVYDEKEIPAQFFIHRNPILENIGIDDEKSDNQFIEMNTSPDVPVQFEDYRLLFNEIDEFCWPEKKNNENKVEKNSEPIFEDSNNPSNIYTEKKSMFPDISANTPALNLRNIILRHLKNVLANVKNFAEDTTIEESSFFYRECMKKFFVKEKFIVQGYKGTGKTYLYRALKNESISSKIREWAGSYNSDERYIFVNVLAETDKEPSFPFSAIKYDKINECEHYFSCFWQVYTWNKLMLDDKNEGLSEIRKKICEQSPLKKHILPIDGMRAKIRFDELIDDDYSMLYIEEDLKKFNEELKRLGTKIFILYDRLDTCISPIYWNKAVSPLINYWRQAESTYSNIMPKIFIRTDLFRQIEGTNTARLSNNIINIEWSIEEVFGYFFKLIFSDDNASRAYWSIAEKLSFPQQYINSIKKTFSENHNQFKALVRAEMDPIVQIFFGKNVYQLGKPWDYFKKELSNADNSSISLRPFINTMDNNAVNQALAIAERYVQEIITPEIYASKTVREKTTETYFNDLAQDPFSKDLLKFKEVIRTTAGEDFRYKSLDEHQFENLINETFKRIENSNSVKTQSDLKKLIFANGIMAEKITTKGRFYVFAPIYWYSWGLKNGVLESDSHFNSHAKLQQSNITESNAARIAKNKKIAKQKKINFFRSLPNEESENFPF